ncbi:MAG: N-acetylgalactosamine-6-sulfatase, partial [Thermogutta sp.]
RPPDRKFFAGTGPYPDLAIREGRWKLLCEYDGSRPELYDLEADPGETKNLADQQGQVVSSLREKLVAWHTSMPQDNGPKLGEEDLRRNRNR